MKGRTSPKRKAKQLVKFFREERPDYLYLRSVFRALRSELSIEREREQKRLPYVPTDEEIRALYKAVWESRNVGDMVLIKTLLYTGARVFELVRIKIESVDLDSCQIRIERGKGGKDRIVPFPLQFRETLAAQMDKMKRLGAEYLFESSWKKPYSERGVRKLLSRYTKLAGIEHSISPHTLRHFLFRWLKSQGMDDALIQPFSGHESRKTLEIYSRLSLPDSQPEYNKLMRSFPV
jgi:integrase/recombinase XerD